MKKEIIPGKGYGDIKFGMSRAEAEKILGKPTEIEKFDDEDMEFWHYDEEILSLTFDGTEDWRLSSMVAGNLGMTFLNSEVDDLTKHDLVNLLKFNGHKNIGFEKEEIDGVGVETVEVDDLEIIFWFEGDELTEVQWGPFFSDEDTIAWPK
jgi:hypothetical protein